MASSFETQSSNNQAPTVLIEKTDDFETKLGIHLTFEEKKELEVDFKPFEVAHGEVLKLQDMINRQAKEKVKTLKELARASKETKEKAGKERKGLAGTLSEKAGEIKDKGMELIEKTKHAVVELGKKVTEKMSPWELVKYTAKMGMFGLQIMFWSALAATGWEWAKNKLHEIEKKKVSETIKAAKEKGLPIPEGLDVEGNKGNEKENNTLDKLGAIAGVSALSVGLFSIIKKIMPSKLAENIDEKNGESILRFAGKRRFLKLFGVSGIALAGAGALYAHLSEHPEKAAELGSIPNDVEGKKAWGKRAIESAGIAGKEEGRDFLGYLTGEKIAEKLEDQPLKEGHVHLKDHPMIKNVEEKIEEFGDKILRMYRENPAAYNALAAVLAVQLGAPFIINAASKAFDIGKTIIFGLGKSAKNHPFLWSMGIVAGLSSMTTLKYMQVKEDAGVEDIEDFAKNVLDYDDFQRDITWMPDSIEPAFDKIAVFLKGGAKLLCEGIEEMATNIWNTVGGAAKEWAILDNRERIDSKNNNGFALFQSDIRVKDEQIENGASLIGEDGKSGIVGALIEKTRKHQKLTESDIHKLIAATKGTNIRIFPEGGEKDTARTIQWVKIDKNGQPINMPRNICLNPVLSETTQAEVSRTFDPHPNEGDKFIKSLGESSEGVRNLISDLMQALTSNDIERTKRLTERFMATGGVIGKAGVNLILQYGKALMVIPNTVKMLLEDMIPGGKDYTAQEYVSEYAGGIVPVMLVGLAKNVFLGGGDGAFRTIISSAAYPITGGIKAAKIGKFIYDRAMVGDYAGIIRDPRNSINNRFFGRSRKFFGHFPLTGEMHLHGQIQEIHGLLQKMKWERDLGLKSEWTGKNMKWGDTAERIKTIINKSEYSKLRKVLGEKGGLNVLDENKMQELLIKIDELIREKKTLGKLELSDAQRKELADAVEKKELEKKQAKAEKAKGVFSVDDVKKAEQETKTKRDEYATKKAELEKAGKDTKAIEKELQAQESKLKELLKVRENMLAREAGKALPHKINIETLHDVKIRGKGIVALIGMVGGAYVISKTVEAIKGPDSGSYRDKSAGDVLGESKPEEDGIDYFGYGVSEDKQEGVEQGDIHCETLADFESREKKMEDEYLADFSNFFEKIKKKNATIEDINKLCENHEKRVVFMQILLKNNKKLLTEFWQKKFPENASIDDILPHDLKEQGIKAFMALFRRNGKFELEFMNKQDMKNALLKIKESSETSTAGAIVDGGMRIIPFVGPALSGADAVKDFSNGNIKSGLWNVGWCVGGLVLDVFTGGTVSSGLRAAKIAGNVAVHTGIMLAGQGVQEYFDKARTDKIEIEKL